MSASRSRILLGLGLTLVATSLLGYGYSRFVNLISMSAGDQISPQKKDILQEKYTCSMHPEILQDHPGNCPICNMALVKTRNGEMVEHADMIHVDAATQKRMGLELAAVTTTEMSKSIHAFATISPDESATVSVNPKVEGFIRHIFVQGVGQPIHQGQVLYEIYSPELQQRQREYIDLLVRKDGLLGDSMSIVSSNSAMVGSLAKEKFRARERLIAADMSEELIEQLEKTRRVIDVIPVQAAHDGVVTTLGMHEGNYVNPMQQILAYVDFNTVWAEISLFPDQIEWLKNGDTITFQSSLDKSVHQSGKVNTSTLLIEPITRIAKLRLPLKNSHGAFRPGAFAEVEISSRTQRQLVIPRDALIRNGQGNYVIIAESNGHFRSAKVKIGIENSDFVAIQSGIKEGDQVAVNGQFLLDGATSMQTVQAHLNQNSSEIINPSQTTMAIPSEKHDMMDMKP